MAERTPDTSSQDTSSSRVRRGGVLRHVVSRLRTAAHLSRARRAEALTEPEIDLVVDEHQLYTKPHVTHRHMTTVLSAAPPPLLDRQASHVSAGDPVFANNRFILGHGRLHFWANYAFGEGRPYLKVSHDVHIEDVAHVMHRNWRMEEPRIVALIISNVAALHDWTNGRQINAFKRGLMKAAQSTHMWIFTNGINIGSARIVGDAVYQQTRETQAYRAKASPSGSLHVVGIMREDHLRYGEAIEGERVELRNEGNICEEEKFELNDSHSHYIVVRDNTVSKTGINLFALRVVQYLSSIGGLKQEFQEQDCPPVDLCSLTNAEIPVVSILIQGGYDSARFVLDHLKRRNPVVVLRGSGGLADLLAFAFVSMQQKCRDLVSAWDAEFVESFLKPELSQKIVNRFPKLSTNQMARNIFRDRIIESVRLAKQDSRIYLSVLNMHNSSCNLENLQEYLLQALFKAQHDEKSSFSPNSELLLKDLYLTMDWNCPHVARNEVISRDPSVVLKLDKVLFETALTRPNREDFVDLFLSHGFRCHKFLTPKRLRILFKRIHGQEFFRSVCWEGVLGHSFGSKLNKDFVDIDLNWLIESVTDLRKFVSTQTLYLNVMGLYPTDAASAERKALALLTMWAVFANRQKLAMVLWKHSDQPIHLGLVVSMMLERLSWYVGEQNLKTELKDPSKVFADYAIGVLDLCFATDESRANDVLSEESSDWNYKKAVDMAANARQRAFLAHPCCQKWLTNTFLGKIRLREMSWGFFTIPPSVKILLSALLVFPMYLWVRFREEQQKVIHYDRAEELEDERDAIDEETHLIVGDHVPPQDAQPQAGGHGFISMAAIGDTIESVLVTKPVELVTKNMDSLARHGKHYSTVIRQREILIRRQPPLWTMVYEMWNAPITKFWTFQLFYIVFLALFSLAVIWPACGNKPLDLCVCVWTGLILVEHIHRTFVLYRKYTSVPMVFKCVEVVAIVSFLGLYAVGRLSPRPDLLVSPYTMKVMLSLALLYFYYRLFAVHLPISPTLGPLLYRLKLMVTVDFVNFMRMALLVIISSGVVLQAVIFPDVPLSLSMLKHTFHRAFFTLFITPLEELKGL